MRIATLDLKLLREAWRARGQMISIALVVASGVMTMVTMRSTYESLEASRAAYYRDYRFADVFVSLVRAPDAIGARLASVPGVAAVETRVVLDVSVDVPGLADPARGRLVSVPPGGPRLNRVHLTAGRLPEPLRAHEVVASQAFATANSLTLGDTLGAVINGRWQTLRIVGLGMSPEYVYEISGDQIFPDNQRFGVLWMEESTLSSAAAMEGAFNDATALLARGASSAAVIAEFDRILEPFGALGALAQEDQLSHRFVADELEGNRISGTFIPAIFLAVAAFLLHIVLSRMVRTQREEIAVLKAFGYSNLDVAWHYLRFAMIAIVLGSVVGAGIGAWLGRILLDVYAIYFQFPEMLYQVSYPLLGVSVLVSAGAAAFGALAAVRGAVKLPPAEAMRPEAPARFRPGILERIGLARAFSPVARMILRSLERQPVRAGLSALAVAFSVAILLVGAFMFDAVQYMAKFQYQSVQREDFTLVFAHPRPSAARFDLASLDGVSRVETFRAVPVRLRSGHRERHVGLTGLTEDGQLRRILDVDRRSHALPESGVLVSTMLAELMHFEVGDTLRLEVLEGGQEVRLVPVAGVVDELMGLNVYMRLDALNALMREGPTVSGAYLNVDEEARAGLLEELKRMPAVAGVMSRSSGLELFEAQLEQTLLVSMSVLIFFAGIIAVGVIYNGARIALSERGRELASLRVLGFTKEEIGVILFGEQAVVTALGIPLGFLLGMGLAAAIVGEFSTEAYRIPLIVSGPTYAFATVVTIFASIFAALLVRRRLNRLDLIEVLKTRE